MRTKQQKKNRRVLTLFLCLLPSILIAMTTLIPATSFRMIFQLMIFLMQYVIIKNLIDDFFGYSDDGESG